VITSFAWIAVIIGTDITIVTIRCSKRDIGTACVAFTIIMSAGVVIVATDLGVRTPRARCTGVGGAHITIVTRDG